MDKVKVIMKQVQKHHFWILSVVAILAALVGSSMAGSALSAAYSSGKGTIDAKFSSLKTVQAISPHPNSEWKQGVEKVNTEQQANVRKAWEMVYNEQKDLLVWPKHLGEDDFLKFIADNPPTAVIPPYLCERYQVDIKDEFNKLLKLIDAQPATTSKDQQSTSGTAAPTHRMQWATASQTEVRSSFHWDAVPSSDEVRRAQEDLWVYTALLTMIRTVNDEHQHTTPIKEIIKIQIGRAAADTIEIDRGSEHVKRIRLPGAEAPGPQTPAPTQAVEGMVKRWDDGRYVEADGKKMLGGATADKEFKRMPIFLKLSIDQREINRLLVEFANCPLPIEVRQVRVNPMKSSAGGGREEKSTKGDDDATHDVPIELQAVVYLYNKPNLGKPGDPAGPGVPGTPGAPPPVATPPGG